MIHEGVALPATVLASKKAPIHSEELICANVKSAGLIDQVVPPNEKATLTCVEQAIHTCKHMAHDGRK
jgi:hypothetical protein